MKKITCFKLKDGYFYNTYRKTISKWSANGKVDITDIESFEGYESEIVNYKLFEPKTIVKKIDPSVKSVHFIPKTIFSRQLFRQMYPNLKIKRDPEGADLIIYDDTEAKKRRYKHSPALYIKIIKKNEFSDDSYLYLEGSLYSAVKDKMTSFAEINGFKFESLNHSENVYVYSQKTYDEHCDFQHNKPYIHTADVFSEGKTELRKEAISLEDAFNLYQQITNGNIDIQKAGLDVLVGLNPRVYLPLQLFLMNFSNKVTPNQRVKIFIEYINKNQIGSLNYNAIHRTNYYTGFSGQSVAPVVLSLQNVITNLEKPIFTEEMDYSILFDLINKKLRDQIIVNGLNNNNHLFLKNPEIGCNHPKVLKSLEKIEKIEKTNCDNKPKQIQHPLLSANVDACENESISEFFV